MTREQHQPWKNVPERPERTREELDATCGRTIAFVLAFGQHAGPECCEDSIIDAVVAACEARVPGVYVLTDEANREDMLAAMRDVNFKKYRTTVEFMGYDEKSAVPLTRDAADFEMCEIPYGLIATMKAIADSVSDEYDSVIAIAAGPSGITSQHLFEICFDHQSHPEVGVIAPWIERLRRPPYLFTRDFMDGLQGSSLTQLRSDKTRAVPRVFVRDHLFGEEKLAVPAAAPTQVSAFLDRCTISALEAVKLAREGSHEALGNVDEMLVRTAEGVLRDAQSLPDDLRAELEWADAFGRANKRDFPLFEAQEHAGKLVYLDSAATTQRVRAALEAQGRFDASQNANVYRGAYPLSGLSTLLFDNARTCIEEFIGAAHNSIAFTMNATAALNLVAQAWGEHNISEGDLILCELSAHHANSMPFAMLAERKGAKVEYVPFDEDGRIDRGAFSKLLERKPKLVCLAHVGNMFGIEAPVRELVEEAHTAGARVLLDAAQSFAHVRIDVRELGVDWVAMSAHKAYGPMGVGALWISEDAFDEMDPLGGGGGVLSHLSTESYYLRPTALQYEPGTPPISQAIGWAAAVDYLDKLDRDDVARHGAALTAYAARCLQRLDGVNVVGDHSGADGQVGLVSFTVRSVTPGATARFLGELGVAIRSGGHCALPVHAAMGMIGTGRLSFGVHTTRDDVDAAITALSLCRLAYES